MPIKSDGRKDSVLSSSPLTDDAIIEEMKEADERCVVLAKEIEQLKLEIAKLTVVTMPRKIHLSIFSRPNFYVFLVSIVSLISSAEKGLNGGGHTSDSIEAGQGYEQASGIRADNAKVATIVGLDRFLESHLLQNIRYATVSPYET